MPANPPDDALAELAELFGVQTAYVDAAGQRRTAGRDTLVAVLGALGVPADDPDDAVREELVRRHLEVLAPVIASPPMVPQVIEVSLPRNVHPRDCWLTIHRQDESALHRTRLMPAVHRPVGGSNLEGQGMDRYEVRIAPSVVSVLSPGYYRLRVEGPDLDASSLVIVPPRCPEPERTWGIFLPVHSIRPSPDWGIGTYPALGDLSAWASGLGAGFVGTLPLFPLLDPEDPSPYLPATRLAWNELYVDPTAVPEAELVPGAADVLGTASSRALGSTLVDYAATGALVRQALEPMAAALWSTPSPRRDQLEDFARTHPEVAAYALFRAEREVPAGTTERDQATGYHLYAQWVADQQLAAAGDRLLLDFPVGVHPDGFDACVHAAAFAGGVQGGAPPDPFFAQGQRWGFRPLHPAAQRASEYGYLIACLRHAMRRASVLRLDHVMSLQRLYWVPDGLDATEGAYVDYPHDELRAIVCLEAAQSSTVVVGEDLGTVPEEVRAAMTQDRMLRSWVLELEVHGPGERAPVPPEMSIASIATHDLPRFAAWWGAGAADALRPTLDQLAVSPARLVMVDVEDLWLERRPHNRPGTTFGNWRHRSERTLEEMASAGEALARVDRLRRAEQLADERRAAAQRAAAQRVADAAEAERAARQAAAEVVPPPAMGPPPRRRRRWWGGSGGARDDDRQRGGAP